MSGGGDGKKTIVEKILTPFVELREMFAELSPRFVALVTAGVLFCVLVVGFVLVFSEPSPARNSAPHSDSADKKIHIKVREGMTTGEIADQLVEKGVIGSSLKFRFLSRVRGYDGKMKPGTYTFDANMADADVFEKLLTGEKYLVRFTIPEGFGVKEIAERLESLDLVDGQDFMKAAETFAPYDYMTRRADVRYAAEGFLFPETYSIESDYSVDEILKMMAAEFDRRLTDEMRARAANMGLSVYDLANLASLVEREVRYEEDLPIVAQVFLKRLKLGMPLQTAGRAEGRRDDRGHANRFAVQHVPARRVTARTDSERGNGGDRSGAASGGHGLFVLRGGQGRAQPLRLHLRRAFEFGESVSLRR
mgnify:CR=1 FL=1